MIIVDESPTFLTDPFVAQLVAGLSNYVNERNYALVLQALNGRDFAESSLIRRAETDALCALLSGPPGRRRRFLQRLAAIDHPLVLFQERLSTAVDDATSIRQDDFGGGKALAELVLQRGARRLLFLVPALAWPAVQERERGIRAAVTDCDCAGFVTVLTCGDGTVKAVIDALDGYMGRRPPEAIMGANDQIGIAAMKWLRLKGLRMPQDVLVTGFNAFEFWNYSDPILTTVRSPAYDIGARGGEALLHRLREGQFIQRDEVLSVELQVGEST
jgi:DNA-binding LacI/PurR family transcriptional regulator